MKILNLYAGIGGNRKLWTDCDVTAVEHNPQIARIYQDFFPDDAVVVGDAHQYLLDHYAEFDFIWSSPPCPTHSQMRYRLGIINEQYTHKAIYPDMTLYQEIIFLQYHHKGLWVVENVEPYYDYLIHPSLKLQRHPFWVNFSIAHREFILPTKLNIIKNASIKQLEQLHDIQLPIISLKNPIEKRKLLRNCVYPPIGEYILNQSRQRPAADTPSMQLALMG